MRRHFRIALCLLCLLTATMSNHEALGANPPAIKLEESPAVLTPTNYDAAYGVGRWIWADQILDKQICRFWKTITIPHGSQVVEARVRTTADNSYRFYVDGQEVTQGSAWESLTERDITALMSPGTHVLAMEAFNDYATAGAIIALQIEMADGSVIKTGSDATWRLVPLGDSGWLTKTRASTDWPRAQVLGSFGASPWTRTGLILKVSPFRPVALAFWQTGWFQISMLSLCCVVVLICLHLMNRLAVQSRAQELLQLERARIARDFHDDLGARITQLVLLSEVARREFPAQTNVLPRLEQLCTRMRDLSGAIKEVVWVVNSQRDTLQDFVSYVCSYAEGFFASTPIRCRFDVGEELPDLKFDLPVRRSLLLAVKEALNNAAKYSQAGELVLRIHCDETFVHVAVEDNGKGFVPALNGANSNGLMNMRQRMQSAGGDCRVISQPGEGCRVELKMPLAHPNTGRRWSPWRRANFTPAAPPDAQPASPTAAEHA